jgi:hypothetical protein
MNSAFDVAVITNGAPARAGHSRSRCEALGVASDSILGIRRRGWRTSWVCRFAMPMGGAALTLLLNESAVERRFGATGSAGFRWRQPILGGIQ